MGCAWVRLPGGDGAAIVCSRGSRPMVCRCGMRATRLCDHRNRDGRTCDAAMCGAHVTRAGKLDYCQAHTAQHLDEIPAALPFEGAP